MLTFSSISGLCEEKAYDLKNPIFHLTTYSGFTAKTSNPDITLWTKTNPFTAKDDELIQGDIIFSPKISAIKDWSASIDLYKPNSVKKYQNTIGAVEVKITEYTYKDTKETTKRVEICMKAKYFANAVIRYSNDEEVEAELHLCRQEPKADGADQPTTAPQSKSPAQQERSVP